jgi:hypothetical protein
MGDIGWERRTCVYTRYGRLNRLLFLVYTTSPLALPSLPGGGRAGTMMQPSFEQSDAEIGRFEVPVANHWRSLRLAESQAVLNPAVWERASAGGRRTNAHGWMEGWHYGLACPRSLCDQHMASIACEGTSCIHTTYHQPGWQSQLLAGALKMLWHMQGKVGAREFRKLLLARLVDSSTHPPFPLPFPLTLFADGRTGKE